MTNEFQILKEIEEELTQKLRDSQRVALLEYYDFTNYEPRIQSLHGVIGGKNNTFVDSVRTQFNDFRNFFALWMKGLIDKFHTEVSYRGDHTEKTPGQWSSAERLVEMMKNPTLLDYTKTFLERNFYRNLRERTRAKPNEKLWSIWFGYKLNFGIFLAPIYKENEWTNDKSEIRRAPFEYWTIGHILQTGIIDPENNKLVHFKSIDNLLEFIQNILKRLSSSQYEKIIYDKYIDYVSKSETKFNIPFLIPEFRFAGLRQKHKHRLDFTILNSHVMKFTGFEISPASSHMRISKLKEKQSKVNDDLKKQWIKEMTKRNDYFSEFDITTITFTDDDLMDIDKCFKEIISYMQETKPKEIDLEYQINRLNQI